MLQHVLLSLHSSVDVLSAAGPSHTVHAGEPTGANEPGAHSTAVGDDEPAGHA